MTIIGILPPEFQMYFPPDSNVPRDIPAFLAFPWLRGTCTLFVTWDG